MRPFIAEYQRTISPANDRNMTYVPTPIVAATMLSVFGKKLHQAKDERLQRKYLMTMAQSREIDAILVTELTRWGRSTVDLVQSLQDLGHFWGGISGGTNRFAV